jgi:hypothetical protein
MAKPSCAKRINNAETVGSLAIVTQSRFEYKCKREDCCLLGCDAAKPGRDPHLDITIPASYSCPKVFWGGGCSDFNQN